MCTKTCLPQINRDTGHSRTPTLGRPTFRFYHGHVLSTMYVCHASLIPGVCQCVMRLLVLYLNIYCIYNKGLLGALWIEVLRIEALRVEQFLVRTPVKQMISLEKNDSPSRSLLGRRRMDHHLSVALRRAA